MIGNWLKRRAQMAAVLGNVSDLIVQALGLGALMVGVLAIVLMLTGRLGTLFLGL